MSLTAQLAAYLQARPNTWIDAHALLQVAGFAAWRTRLSECRRPPFNLTIENRTRRVNGYTVSEYRFTPGLTGDSPADHRDTALRPRADGLVDAGERPAPGSTLFDAQERVA